MLKKLFALLEWGDNECSHFEDVGLRCSGPDTSKQCVTSCGNGYFASENACVECPLDCKTCDGSDSCLKCVELRFSEDKKCIPQCQLNTFGNTTTRRCKSCPSKCATCVQTKSYVVCTSCLPGKFHDGNDCVESCDKMASFSSYIRLSGNYSTFSAYVPSNGNYTAPYIGLLEVRYNGTWHTVCNEKFDLEDARVFCREMGYGQPISFQGGLYGRGNGKIISRGLECTGKEKTFADCPQKSWFSRGCTHYQDMGMICMPPAAGYVVQQKCVLECDDGLYRSSQNTCELCHRLCATCEGSPKNCTSCRKPYYFSKMGCSLDCSSGQYGNEAMRACLPCSGNCITCSYTAYNCSSCVPPLLYDGTHCVSSCPPNMFHKGRTCVTDCGLKYYVNVTQFSKVCQACPVDCIKCGLNNATIVCRLCAVGHVLTSEGKCAHTCPPGHVLFPVAVKTIGIEPMIRLRNTLGGSRYIGRLEVFHDEVWGSVCDHYWRWKSFHNAMVACAQLYLGPPKVVYYGMPKKIQALHISKIWLNNVRCNGEEHHIWDCKHSGWGSYDSCDHSDDVYLECQTPGVVTCVKQCPTGYYRNESICLPCDYSCTTCVDSVNNCSNCSSGFYHTPNNTCVTHCPIGFYTSNKQCQVCYSSCLTCDVAADNCTSCRSPYFLSGNTCVLNCPERTYKRLRMSGIKLIYKSGPYEGVVQVTFNGKTGVACDRNLTMADGNVICRQLRMSRAESVYTQLWFDQILISYPTCAA
ncbi:deleted in malignant brain tumors 1 -like [Paramuricea clavata]|uniref:Deleted in malignant brain tumors 1 -like n=1 Tax=Paramuricea clavata TaxID=317549 RepID=A0A7D9HID8_PARCT|nr:deleted in malignant brain tumors 1 -like [Paramuricea clavata]